MRSYIQSGDTLDVVAGANVASGQLAFAGDIFGVAVTSALAGATFAIKRSGVFELPKNSAEAWATGQAVYWDATNLVVTATAASNKGVGVASEPAANPSSVGRVLLREFVA